MTFHMGVRLMLLISWIVNIVPVYLILGSISVEMSNTNELSRGL